MTALLVFVECEPFIVMTSRAAVDDGRLAEVLTRRGFPKFIAHEVPLEKLRLRYGVPFEVIEADVREGNDVRVLDFNGNHIFEKLSLTDLGECIRHDPEPSAAS